MVSIRKSGLAVVILLTAIAAMAFGQGPLHKRVNYTVNVSHAVKMGDYMLPPGKYVIYQIDQNDTNLFALYQNDMTHSPVAMIRTTRVDYQGGHYPSSTSLVLDIDESSRDLHPVLKGWNIPGEDGWEIISVVSKRNGVLTRIN